MNDIGINPYAPSSLINNIVLMASLNRFEGLNISLLNTRSIFHKMDEIKLLIFRVKLDILCFVETWLHDGIPDDSINISGFNVLRLDRSRDNAKTGGGICVFVKSMIEYKIVQQHCSPNLEILLIELTLESTKILLVTVYKPPKAPRQKFHEEFKRILENFTVDYTDILICGDFNCDLKAVTSSSKKLNSLLNKFCLKSINTEPTYFFKNSSSLLDLVISNTDKIKFLNQVSVGFTDHDFLFFSYDIKYKRSNPTFTFRDFNSMDPSYVFSKCDKINWNLLYSLTNPTDKVDYLTNSIKNLFDDGVPLRTVVVKTGRPPWLNNEIIEMLNMRNFIFRRWKHSKNDDLLQEYRSIRNRIKNIIKRAKQKYFSTVLNSSLPSKVFWKNLRSIGPFSSTKKNLTNRFSPNDFNTYFSLNSICTEELVTIDDIKNSNDSENNFSFSNIDIVGLNDAFNSIKSNATGVDEIPIKFVKLLLPRIDCYLLHVFNSLITFSTFPSGWKHSIIIPIPKKKMVTTLSDYRPISLLPALSKVFERVLQSQILSYVESQNLLSKYQSAYRLHHSTNSALLNINDDIRRGIDKGEICSLVLLDFSKAFDKINHSILIRKLYENFKFSVPACRLISSYLYDRSQSVKVNSNISNICHTNCGVPQGSVLGPFLFMMYINDVTSVITQCKYHLFADDLQIYKFCSPKDICDSISKVNSDIDMITHWSIDNKFDLNSEKSQCIIISSTNRCTSSFPKIYVKETVIEYSESVNNLGLIFDKTTCWNYHVEAICHRVIFLLRMLWATTKCFNSNLRLQLVKSYVLPHLMYGDIVLFELKGKYFNELQMVFNSCLRYVFKLKKFDHISEYTNLLLGCSLEQFYEYRVCLFIFKFQLYQQPTYIASKLITSSNRRSLLLIPAINRCRLMNSSFFVRGVSIWNSLNKKIKNSKSPAMFQKEYFSTFFPKNN